MSRPSIAHPQSQAQQGAQLLALSLVEMGEQGVLHLLRGLLRGEEQRLAVGGQRQQFAPSVNMIHRASDASLRLQLVGQCHNAGSVDLHQIGECSLGERSRRRETREVVELHGSHVQGGQGPLEQLLRSLPQHDSQKADVIGEGGRKFVESRGRWFSKHGEIVSPGQSLHLTTIARIKQTQRMSETQHPNVDIALGVSRAILAADWATLDGLLAPDFTYDGDLGQPYTRDEYIGFMQAMKGAMSDMAMDFTHIVASDDLVSVRFVTTARQTGKFMGAPATGKNLEIRGIFMRRIADGKVVQEWQATDLLWMMTQMGFGSLMGYTIAAGVLHKQAKIPARIA